MAGKFRAARFLRIALYMILMGVLTCWALVLAIPVAIEWEIAQSTANRIPVYGFFIGAALGLGMGLSAPVRHAALCVLGIVTAGGVVWFLSVVFVGGGLIFIGVSEETVDRIMDWIDPAAFFVGVVLGSIGVLAASYGKLDARLARIRERAKK
jgi:hypothetical protein